MSKRGETTVNVPDGPGVPGGTLRKHPQSPVHLGGDPHNPQPFLHPGVSDPSAIRYAQAAEQRRKPAPAPIPRYTEQVAGGPNVPIPRLDGEPQGNLTMAQQALLERGGPPIPPMPNLDEALKAAGVGFPGAAAPSIVEGVAHQAAPVEPRSGGLRPPPGIMPGDLLPPAAKQDPAYMEGQGSAFAANQPHLAMKYGVIRNGQYIAAGRLKTSASPGAPATASGASPFRQETLEGLQAIQNLQSQQAVDNLQAQRAATESDSAATDRQIENEALRGPARAGGGGSARPMSEDEKRQFIDELDEFDLERVRKTLFKDLLNNDEQKKIIEARLRPLDLGELITTTRVTQVVPIVPGSFEPEYQSYSAVEDLIIKRMIGEEGRALQPSERYLLDKYTLMGLTVALKSINGRQFPDYRDHNGTFHEDSFWKKFNMLSKYDFHMIASLTVNWFWFDMRVRKLFKAEALGNG